MNPDCERALREMDADFDAAWLQEHFAACAVCRAEGELRARLRLDLRRAVRSATVDPKLESRVRVAMAPPGFRQRWQPYAAAAAVLIAVGSYWAVPWAESRMSESAYFSALPEMAENGDRSRLARAIPSCARTCSGQLSGSCRARMQSARTGLRASHPAGSGRYPGLRRHRAQAARRNVCQ